MILRCNADNSRRADCQHCGLPIVVNQYLYKQQRSKLKQNLLPTKSQACNSMMHARSGMSTKHWKAERHRH